MAFVPFPDPRFTTTDPSRRPDAGNRTRVTEVVGPSGSCQLAGTVSVAHSTEAEHDVHDNLCGASSSTEEQPPTSASATTARPNCMADDARPEQRPPRH